MAGMVLAYVQVEGHVNEEPSPARAGGDCCRAAHAAGCRVRGTFKLHVAQSSPAAAICALDYTQLVVAFNGVSISLQPAVKCCAIAQVNSANQVLKSHRSIMLYAAPVAERLTGDRGAGSSRQTQQPVNATRGSPETDAADALIFLSYMSGCFMSTTLDRERA